MVVRVVWQAFVAVFRSCFDYAQEPLTLCGRGVHMLESPANREETADEGDAVYLVDGDPGAEIGVLGYQLVYLSAKAMGGGRGWLVVEVV